ncbi:MAG: alpha-1,2-fucosyltransferase [Rhodoferax sp.]|nr:alpha-1,2-fucosyltransferase [Rhodoferax sp.]
MIISQLRGGLGNQMFQYAAGRSLALARNVGFRVDATGLGDSNSHQGFELQRIFGEVIVQANAAELVDILQWRANSAVQYVLCKPFMRHFRGACFIAEPHFQFWTEFEDASDNIYLSGYWQSHRYFSRFTAQIREDFSFKKPLSQRNRQLAKEIVSSNSVSLHVRRGDYISNAKASAKHGVCPLQYYQRAIEIMNQRFDNAVFYIFSDDLDWVHQHLEVNGACVYVNHNLHAESFIDMQLMGLCRHHIIANSTFSWWGAWLNPDPHKNVIAPLQWFADGTNVQDLLPSEWMKI